MDAVISAIVEHSHAVVNQGSPNTEKALLKFFTPDAQFTNAMGGHFPNLTAITGAWSKWYSTLTAANDVATDHVFDGEKLRAQWALTGTVTQAIGGTFEFYDTLTAQFARHEGNVRIVKLTSKLHRWQPAKK